MLNKGFLQLLLYSNCTHSWILNLKVYYTVLFIFGAQARLFTCIEVKNNNALLCRWQDKEGNNRSRQHYKCFPIHMQLTARNFVILPQIGTKNAIVIVNSCFLRSTSCIFWCQPAGIYLLIFFHKLVTKWKLAWPWCKWALKKMSDTDWILVRETTT